MISWFCTIEKSSFCCLAPNSSYCSDHNLDLEHASFKNILMHRFFRQEKNENKKLTTTGQVVLSYWTERNSRMRGQQLGCALLKMR